MPTVLNWDGEKVPEELRRLPRGRYVVESIDDAEPLTDDQEAGIVAAIESVAKGQGVKLDDAKRAVDGALRG